MSAHLIVVPSRVFFTETSFQCSPSNHDTHIYKPTYWPIWVLQCYAILGPEGRGGFGRERFRYHVAPLDTYVLLQYNSPSFSLCLCLNIEHQYSRYGGVVTFFNKNYKHTTVCSFPPTSKRKKRRSEFGKKMEPRKLI